MAHKQPFDEKYIEKTRMRLKKYSDITASLCWIWRGAANPIYGVMYFKRRQTYAHRVSYEVSTGIDPGSFRVCHHCDNPLCINPDHLFLGTDKENMEDCRRKGRGIHGSLCTNSKLKKENVLEIRRLLESGISQYKIAKQFGIAQTSVSGIKNGRYWKHI